MKILKSKQVIGAVVDVEFDEKLPQILNALHINDKRQRFGIGSCTTSRGKTQFVSVAMDSTDGLVRGQKVEDTGVTDTSSCRARDSRKNYKCYGEPIDERGPIKANLLI